ncbi:MAG TPA: SDR family NAD(P)-dependent oxidoreductase [Spirochaetia bacterium]|nr:SDR family NAD(P)-dependent oxidoreductase [Spirochaetia bacterium]
MQKTVLITGATSGIGLAGAEALARRGWRVLVHGRSDPRVAQALEKLKARVPTGAFEGVSADLGSLSSVAGLAEQVKARTTSLDALWNNAGAVASARATTADGLELQMQVNYLAPYALSLLLLPLLRAAPQGRIVITSSMAHLFAPRRITDWLLTEPGRYRPMAVYGQSKLATILFTQELARRLSNGTVTVNAYHPGFVRSEFGVSRDGGKGASSFSFAHFLAITPEKGADTGVYLVDDPAASRSTGRYWAKRRTRNPSRQATPQAAARLWEESESAVKKVLGALPV